MHRRAFLGTTTTLVITLAAGCAGGDGGSGGDGGGGGGMYGGDSGGGGGGGGETTESGTTASGGAQSVFPDYEWGKLEGADASETSSVTMRNTEFHPLVAKVSAGTEVTFTNEDSGGHSVTIPALGVDETVSGGSATSVTFEEAGTVDYVCTFHPPGMLGRIVVE